MSHRVSDVSAVVSSRPGTGGRNDREPVATTKRRAVERMAVDLDLAGSHEAGVSREDLDAVAGEHLGGLVLADLRADGADVGHHAGGVDPPGPIDRKTEPAEPVRDRGGASGREQGLARHAAAPRALPAKPSALDERDARAETARDQRSGQAR